MTIFGVKILVQNFTTNILGKVTQAFDLIIQGLRMATKNYIGGHKMLLPPPGVDRLTD